MPFQTLRALNIRSYLCTFINYNEHYYFYSASYMHGWATHWWAGWPPLDLWPWPEHVQWVSALLDFEIAQLKWIQSAESSSWGHQQAHHLERGGMEEGLLYMLSMIEACRISLKKFLCLLFSAEHTFTCVYIGTLLHIVFFVDPEICNMHRLVYLVTQIHYT